MRYIISCSVMLLLVNFSYSQARYYKAQMHCHTTNSDGAYSPMQLAAKYKAAGYEIIFFTDHDYLTNGDSVFVPGILCISGEEISFKRHMNGFFLKRTIIPDENFTCQQAIDSVLSQGGLIQLNHYCAGPLTPDEWEVSASEIISFQNGPHMLEIWNTSTESIQTHDDKSIWDAVLTSGKVVWGSATDDFHPSVSEAVEFNKGWNMIWLDTLTKEAVYDALLNGRFYASTGVVITQYKVDDYGTYKVISVSSSNATKIKFWGPNHVVLQEISGASASFILQNHSYVRIELIKEGFLGMGNLYAWTQPVFLNNPMKIEESKQINYVKLYPNPNSNSASLDININTFGHLKVDILSINGKHIENVDERYIYEYFIHYELNLINLQSGYYILKVQLNNDVKSIIFQKL